jgi:hypothetical protein
MMHMDIGTANAIIAIRDEKVARMLRDARGPGVVSIAIGSWLVRLGEWLRRDVEMPHPPAATTRRPQVA